MCSLSFPVSRWILVLSLKSMLILALARESPINIKMQVPGREIRIMYIFLGVAYPFKHQQHILAFYTPPQKSVHALC
jgi:hypothetical protein